MVGAEGGMNCLGVGGQPGRETQACGPLRNDRLRSENMHLERNLSTQFCGVAQWLGCGPEGRRMAGCTGRVFPQAGEVGYSHGPGSSDGPMGWVGAVEEEREARRWLAEST